MPRPRKTPAEMQAMRERILDTAYAILEESGPNAITSRSIAERLGMAHMSLFTYFDNQAAIISALRGREMARWQHRLAENAARAQREDIRQVVRKHLTFYTELARENPNLYYLAWVAPEESEEHRLAQRVQMMEIVEGLAVLLELGMAEGAFARRDALMAAISVLGMVNVPNILYFSGKVLDPRVRDRMVAEMLPAAMLYLETKKEG